MTNEQTPHILDDAALLLRSEVLQLLDDSAHRRLTLVAAPPGYGKTTLLGEWRRRLAAAERPFLWYTLVRDDDEHALRAGLQRSAATLGVGSPREGPDSDDAHAFFRMLPDGITLFVDGFGQETDGSVASLLGRLLADREKDIRLVLAASRQPDLPLATMEAYGLLARVDVRDLAFDRARTQMFLTDTLGVECSSEMVRQYQELTEGWPAGLKLVAAANAFVQQDGALRLPAKAYRLLDGFFHENVFRYLTDEQLSQLVELSTLASWDAALCEQLFGERYRSDFPETLLRRQFFVVEGADGTLRPQRLFAEALARRRGKAAAIQAHRNAATILAQAGEFAEAVDHALAAGDVGPAADWAERCAMDQFDRGGQTRVRAWIDALPSAEVDDRPRLCLAAGHAFYGNRQPEKALRYLDAGARVLRADLNQTNVDLLHQIRLLQTFYPIVCDDSHAARHVLASPESELTDNDVAASQLVRAWCALYDQGVPAAAAIIGDGDQGPLDGTVTIDLYRCALRALIVRHSGDLHRSRAIGGQAYRLACACQGPLSPMAALAASEPALLTYEWGQVSDVEAQLPEFIPGLLECGSVEGLIAGFFALIRSQAAVGRTRDAWATLAQLEELAVQRNIFRLIAFCTAERAHLHLLEGDLNDAEAAAFDLAAHSASDGPSGESARFASRMMTLRTSAAVNIAAGDPELAMQSLLIVSDQLARLGFNHDLAGVRAAMAIALHQIGQRQEARQCAASAMLIGEAGGMMRSFADCGPKMATVLRDLRGALGQRSFRKVSQPYVDSVIDYLDSDVSLREPVSVAAIVRSAPLSSREAEIAQLIHAGLSNKEIGRRLDLSNETVKWHLSNIYQKLGVANRTKAVQAILRLLRNGGASAPALRERSGLRAP